MVVILYFFQCTHGYPYSLDLLNIPIFFKMEMLYGILFLYQMLRIFKIINTENQTGIKPIS